MVMVSPFKNDASFLWERHLAAMLSRLEASPTIRYRESEDARHSLIFQKPSERTA
jgi:hypothetical protein